MIDDHDLAHWAKKITFPDAQQCADMATELLRRREAEDWQDINTIPDEGPVLCGFAHRTNWHTSTIFDPQQAKAIGLYTHWRRPIAPPEVKS